MNIIERAKGKGSKEVASLPKMVARLNTLEAENKRLRSEVAHATRLVAERDASIKQAIETMQAHQAQLTHQQMVNIAIKDAYEKSSGTGWHVVDRDGQDVPLESLPFLVKRLFGLEPNPQEAANV